MRREEGRARHARWSVGREAERPFDALVGRVRERAPAGLRAEPTAVVSAVLAALGEPILETDRRVVAPLLPPAIGRALASGPVGRDAGLAQVVDRVSRGLGVAPGRACGLVLAVAQGLGEVLDAEEVQILRARLPEGRGDLLVSAPPQRRSPPRPASARGAVPRAGRRGRGGTLAEGRPWSRRAVCDGAPGWLGQP